MLKQDKYIILSWSICSINTEVRDFFKKNIVSRINIAILA